ncbi:serum response factor-binding protein 1-like [Cydia pomonella]|uniref:serum response factor-binding protein 1-like n=1 Tax=Cydia pomonella TaxID=82600 RepID=UPI002ADE264E|nr:serum response factor-binding protein 1-like [Cydia pomonella]
MEVGAVKQAFNNEVIQLKKNLNQAKIQIIHKLTRKAKKEVKKEAPEKLKEKFKRQAASAVNEVLIIKKIKPRDIARFTVTHAGELQQHLNKPTVDQDKACARLLLHKSLQQKYKHIRNTFSGIPIKDLLMSRQERLKLKREAKLDKKMKRDKKQKVVNAEGEWDVEDINTRKVKDAPKITSKNFKESDDEISADDEEMELDENANSDKEVQSDDEEDISHGEEANSDDQDDKEDGNQENQSDESEAESETKMEGGQESNSTDNEPQSKKKEVLGKFIKPSPVKVNIKQNESITSALTFEQLGKNRRKPEIKKPIKPKDMHKNKNLNDKLQSRKFKKESSESQVKETKIVDPFFITSTGENYLSVAEPRQPDEVKEIHKQGNRKERRAAMFGHVPKVKPRKDFRQSNSDRTNNLRNKLNKDDNYNQGNDGKNRNESRFNGKDQFRNQNDKPFGRNNHFKGRNDKPGEDRNDFKSRNDKFKGRNNDAAETKVEKLHPSWEAKKKQSGILPFQGKKIVFDEG